MQLIGVALNNGWEIPAAKGADAIRVCLEIIDDPTATRREKIRAVETLDAIRRTSISAASLDLQAQRIEASRPDLSLTVADAMRECDQIDRALSREAD